MSDSVFPLFLTSIRSPFESDKLSIHTQAIQDSRGCDRIKDLSPVGRNEIGGDQGGGDLCAFGEDLKDPIGLFFGGNHIAEFIETKDRDFGIVVDETVEIFGFGEFGGKVKEAEKDGLVTLEDGFITEGGGQMGFAHSRRTDQDEIGGLFEPLGVNKLHDLILGDFGIKGPVEVTEPFDAFDPRHTHQVFNAFLFPQTSFIREEAQEECFFLLRESLGIRAKMEGFP